MGQYTRLEEVIKREVWLVVPPKGRGVGDKQEGTEPGPRKEEFLDGGPTRGAKLALVARARDRQWKVVTHRMLQPYAEKAVWEG